MSHARSFLVVILFILSIPILISNSPAAVPVTYQVQVRETYLRATPSFLGKITATLRYGERVSIIIDRGVWKKVAVPATRREGWIHGSAITTRTLVLKSGTQGVKTGATSREVALAGKGFNEQIEQEFRKKNRNLDFTWVDRMETFKVTSAQLQTFLEDGSLRTSEGGVR